MKKRKTIQPFAYDLEETDLKRERRKARELREGPSGGSAGWQKGSAITANAQRLPKNSPWIMSSRFPAAGKAPKEMLCRAARRATPPKNNSCPWNGKTISYNSPQIYPKSQVWMPRTDIIY